MFLHVFVCSHGGSPVRLRGGGAGRYPLVSVNGSVQGVGVTLCPVLGMRVPLDRTWVPRTGQGDTSQQDRGYPPDKAEKIMTFLQNVDGNSF